MKLNVVGAQNTVADLFDEFDEDCSGEITYEEFAFGLLGVRTGSAKEDAANKGAVERVKAKIFERGGKNAGIRACTRILAAMDKDGNRSLDREEFQDGFGVYGVELNEDDMDKLMRHFDKDNSGKVTIEEFLKGIRGRMPRCRRVLVRQAFNILDEDGSGEITMEEFKCRYDASKHPDVMDEDDPELKKAAEERILDEFMDTWDADDSGIITWKEFYEYYQDISAGIDMDDYFELMIRNAWHMSGGEGWCANTSNTRVLVMHRDKDGNDWQTVEEIQDDLGLDKSDKEEMIRRLKKQGVKDILDVQLS